MLMVASVHLQSLFLRRQRVDESYPPGFVRQLSHLVARVLPPRLADVTVPVGARPGGGHMHEAPPGGVVPCAMSQWVHEPQDLRTDKR